MHIRRSGQLQVLKLFEDHGNLNWNERRGGDAEKRWDKSDIIGIYFKFRDPAVDAELGRAVSGVPSHQPDYRCSPCRVSTRN